MTDGWVRVKEAADTGAPEEKLIDNDELTVGGETVFRQRVVAFPGAETPIKALDGGGTTLQQDVTSTALRVDDPPLANRKGVSVYADEDNTLAVFYGYSNAVTTATGFKLVAGSSKEWDHDENTELWMIAASGSHKVYVDQVADTL